MTNPHHPAQRLLVAWLLAWRARDWQGMAGLSQHTWRSIQPDGAAESLERLFGERELTDFVVHGGRDPTGTFCREDVSADLVANGQALSVVARCVCEMGPFTPHPRGTWGVNPVSVLRQS